MARRRQGRGRAQAADQESFTERVGRLRSEVTGDPAHIAALHSELAHILRAAHGDQRSGWSDEEWIERAELSGEQRDELRRVLASCAEVKYGGSQPTRFAVEELLDRVGALVSSADEVAA